jgi:hypothetical protein
MALSAPDYDIHPFNDFLTFSAICPSRIPDSTIHIHIISYKPLPDSISHKSHLFLPVVMAILSYCIAIISFVPTSFSHHDSTKPGSETTTPPSDPYLSRHS